MWQSRHSRITACSATRTPSILAIGWQAKQSLPHSAILEGLALWHLIQVVIGLWRWSLSMFFRRAGWQVMQSPVHPHNGNNNTMNSAIVFMNDMVALFYRPRKGWQITLRSPLSHRLGHRTLPTIPRRPPRRGSDRPVGLRRSRTTPVSADAPRKRGRIPLRRCGAWPRR